MTLKDLILRAEKAGNEPEGSIPDRREAFVYMDVTSQHYREEIAKHAKQSRDLNRPCFG